MKQTKRISMLLVILLSVSFTGASFAAEATLPVDQAIVEQAAFSMEPTPTVVTTLAPTPVPAAPSEAPAASAEPDPTAIPATDATATQVPATETPAETATPAPTESSLDVTATETPAIAVAVRSVDIRMDMPAALQMGDTVALIATLNGYDDVTVALQWQYTRDGEHWFDADGATSLTYAFTVNDDTAGTGWRLAVSIL